MPAAGYATIVRHRRRAGVDLRPGLGDLVEREDGGVAQGQFRTEASLSVRPVAASRCRILPSPNRVSEGQRVGTGAAGIGRGAAIAERQRRRATCNRHDIVQTAASA